MRRVVLTGAAGFIGRHCPPRLIARGYEVHAVSSQSVTDRDAGIRWHEADLLDPRQSAALMSEVRPTHMLHLAWGTSPAIYRTSADNVRWVQASLDLAQAFVRNGGQRMVVAGTCAEYDWRFGYCSEETTPQAPATLYGVCKHSLQMLLAALSRQAGTSAAWGRLFFLFGPFEHPERLVASVVRALLSREPARCTEGRQIRDFLYVEDAADAFVSLLHSDWEGPVNIASGTPVSVRDVVWSIADQLGRHELLQLGALPAREDEPPVLVADVRRLRAQVGWTPRYDLETGLAKTIQWWKDRSGAAR